MRYSARVQALPHTIAISSFALFLTLEIAIAISMPVNTTSAQIPLTGTPTANPTATAIYTSAPIATPEPTVDVVTQADLLKAYETLISKDTRGVEAAFTTLSLVVAFATVIVGFLTVAGVYLLKTAREALRSMVEVKEDAHKLNRALEGTEKQIEKRSEEITKLDDKIQELKDQLREPTDFLRRLRALHSVDERAMSLLRQDSNIDNDRRALMELSKDEDAIVRLATVRVFGIMPMNLTDWNDDGIYQQIVALATEDPERGIQIEATRVRQPWDSMRKGGSA